MLDAHCHVDLYADPSQIAQDADAAGVFTVLVTNSPSAYQRAQPHTKELRRLRLALGIHPLQVEAHSHVELSLFKALVHTTSFIGEVGLDFSWEGKPTREKQIESFRFALSCLDRRPKFVSIHSRKAEGEVLGLVNSDYGLPVVFHWYSGSLRVLHLAIDAGHYFSINPAMLQGNGGKIVAHIPADRVLTESDGPFVRIGERTVCPSDVSLVEEGLASYWKTDMASVRRTIKENFHTLLAPLRTK